MKDLAKLYPDLNNRLKPYRKSEASEVVKDFAAREVVITGADFQMRKSPKVEAECALIAMYDEAGEKDRPVVVEFSFKYENEREGYSGKAAQRAYDVFSKLKDMSAAWVDSDGPIKTAYVYS